MQPQQNEKQITAAHALIAKHADADSSCFEIFSLLKENGIPETLASTIATDLRPQRFPHEGGCADCRAMRRCSYCGSRFLSDRPCTNGRCRKCHGKQCTSGGATSPGHGYGKCVAPPSDDRYLVDCHCGGKITYESGECDGCDDPDPVL